VVLIKTNDIVSDLIAKAWRPLRMGILSAPNLYPPADAGEDILETVRRFAAARPKANLANLMDFLAASAASAKEREAALVVLESANPEEAARRAATALELNPEGFLRDMKEEASRQAHAAEQGARSSVPTSRVEASHEIAGTAYDPGAAAHELQGRKLAPPPVEAPIVTPPPAPAAAPPPAAPGPLLGNPFAKALKGK
jgi:hypothetical protein